MRSPEEPVQVGCVVAALDLLLHHSQRPQPATAETKCENTNKQEVIHLCESSLCMCGCFHALPAVDCSSCVCLPCPAAAVCPGPLVAVPGQTQAAVHCERVADLFTHMLVSGGFPKISIQQGQVTDPCS